MFPLIPQLYLAKYLKRKYPDIKIYGLGHLSPTFLYKKNIYPALIKKWSKYVDKILTFGSSLTKYFVNSMNMLEKNRDKVMDMKRASLFKSQTLYIETIHEWFTNL